VDFFGVPIIAVSRDGMIKNLLRRCASFSFSELNPTANIMFAVFLIEERGLMKSLSWFSSLKKIIHSVLNNSESTV
jgi:hypothetical protein